MPTPPPTTTSKGIGQYRPDKTMNYSHRLSQSIHWANNYDSNLYNLTKGATLAALDVCYKMNHVRTRSMALDSANLHLDVAFRRFESFQDRVMRSDGTIVAHWEERLDDLESDFERKQGLVVQAKDNLLAARLELEAAVRLVIMEYLYLLPRVSLATAIGWYLFIWLSWWMLYGFKMYVQY